MEKTPQTNYSLRPFFCYYGGKWRIAPHYPKPVYDTIIEPFAGGAGYALRHYRHNVILVEKNPRIASLWRYLTKVTSEEILSLPDLMPGQTTDDLNIGEDAKALIGFWLNKGTVQPCKRPSKWASSGIRPNSFWGPAVRRSLAAQVEAISHWTIVEGDYSIAPDIKATWFIDPPYADKGKHYTESSSSIDFTALGEWCRNRQGQVIVCENEGAAWLPFEPLTAKTKDTPGKHRSKPQQEVIYHINT